MKSGVTCYRVFYSRHEENKLDMPVYAVGTPQCSITPKIRKIGCGRYLCM